MKKLIAIVLAAVMVLALAGCGSSVDAGKLDEILSAVQSIQAQVDALQGGAPAAAEAPAEEPAEEPEAAEEPAPEAGDKIVVDFEWNGQKEVWSVLPTTGAEGLVWINDAMGAVMEAQGFLSC